MFRLTEGSPHTENKENESPPQKEENVANDSISDMFQKLSINDRRSSLILSKDSCVKPDTDEYVKYISSGSTPEFMTSSPIQQRPKLVKPIFTRIESNEAPRVDINLVKTDDELIQRSQTVRVATKPPLIPTKNTVEVKKPVANVSTNQPRKMKPLNLSNSFSKSQNSTVPKPFSFESKDKALLENRKKLVEDDLLEKKRLASAFRANPMPISSPVSIEMRIMKGSQSNVSSKSSSFSSYLPGSSVQASRTRDLSYLHKSPLRPKPSTLTLTCPETPHLLLPKRLEQRKVFDEQQHAREQLYLKIKGEFEEEKLQKEKEEMKRLREEQHMIKANPIRVFKNVPAPIPKSTTQPCSPKFSDRFKK